MIKLISMILLCSSFVSSYQNEVNKLEIEETQQIGQNHKFSNSNNKAKEEKTDYGNVLTAEEQNAYIQEMETLIDTADGNDLIIKDAENEASDLKEIIFKDDFDITVEENATSANVELDY